MKQNVLRTVLSATILLSLAAAGHAQPTGVCSAHALAGEWGYTFTGTLILPSGAVPAAAVGRFTLDSAGNLSGTQASSSGDSVSEDLLSGTGALNSDCTATVTVRIYSQSGTLLRTAVLALVFVNNATEFRAIFKSLVLANGPSVAVVVTMDGKKMVPGRGNEQ